MKLTLPIPLSVLITEFVIRRENRKHGYRNPPVSRRKAPVAVERRRSFEDLWERTMASGKNPVIDYQLPYPKIEFLHYLCDEMGFVAHGSNNTDLSILQPIRKSTDSSEFGRRNQIFCSPDGAWASWFAILNKGAIRYTNNGCVRVGPATGRWVKLCYFTLHRNETGTELFCPGVIYIARAAEFPARRTSWLMDFLGIEIEEWGSPNPVVPVSRLPFLPDDFPYMDRVEQTTHP